MIFFINEMNGSIGTPTTEKRIKNQVTVLQGLEKTFYGATEFSILDNNHYMLTFAEDE